MKRKQTSLSDAVWGIKPTRRRKTRRSKPKHPSGKKIVELELNESENEAVRRWKSSVSQLGHPQLRKFLDIPTNELKKQVEDDSKTMKLRRESWNRAWRGFSGGRGQTRGGGVPLNYALMNKEDEIQRKREALKLREKWEQTLCMQHTNKKRRKH